MYNVHAVQDTPITIQVVSHIYYGYLATMLDPEAGASVNANTAFVTEYASDGFCWTPSIKINALSVVDEVVRVNSVVVPSPENVSVVKLFPIIPNAGANILISSSRKF